MVSQLPQYQTFATHQEESLIVDNFTLIMLLNMKSEFETSAKGELFMLFAKIFLNECKGLRKEGQPILK